MSKKATNPFRTCRFKPFYYYLRKDKKQGCGIHENKDKTLFHKHLQLCKHKYYITVTTF